MINNPKILKNKQTKKFSLQTIILKKIFCSLQTITLKKMKVFPTDNK